MIKLEKGIPIPPRRTLPKRELVAAMKKMKVGDSFIYGGPNPNPVYLSARLAGIVVTGRREEPIDGIKTWRFWRRK
jgi:hypothetical protein